MKVTIEILFAALLMFTVACKNYNETENNSNNDNTSTSAEADVRRDSTAMNKDEAVDVHTNNNPE